MSDTERIPVRGTLRGLRHVSRSRAGTRCTAAPIGNAWGADAETQAAGDLMCLEPAGMFDAARGHFVCDEHGGVLRDGRRDVQRRLDLNPFYRLAELPRGAQFAGALALIESWLREAHPDGDPAELLDAALDALSHQARVSLHLAVTSCDN